MNNRTSFQLPKFDGGAGVARAETRTGRLLEETKLSRLPAMSRPRPAACVVCGERLDPNSDFQQSTKIGTDCLRRFAQISQALDTHSDRKAQAAKLAQWQGGINY